MQRINFYLGEERHVRLMVYAVNKEAFTIRAASWSLQWAGKEEATGECLIEEHVLDAKIAPLKRTTYQLVITYYVADEILVEKIEVIVN